MKYLSIVSIVGISMFFCSCSDDSKDGDKSDSPNYYQISEVTDTVFTGGIEGPAYYKGKLYAVNFEKEGTIGIVESNSNISSIDLPKGSVGNGIRFDMEGSMYIADYPKHNILKIAEGSKEVEVFANEDQMNQPNDIAIMKDGTLFASDPNWGESTGNLWSISNEGIVTLLEGNMGTTNGVEVSADEKYLYVNESIQRKVWRYEIHADKSVTNKTLFYEFTDFGMDGMRCDLEGNLYIARYGKGVVAIISSEGELIREVKLPGMNPTNVAFGGSDFKTIFVTLQSEKEIVSFLNEKAGRVSLFVK